MNILYLYSELMGYQIPILKEYTSKYNAKVHVIHWDHKKLTPYKLPKIENVNFYNKSEFDYNKLVDFTNNLNPDIVYVSGWMDKDYLRVAKILKRKNIPIVCGLDNQWRGTIKQKIASLISRFSLKKIFDYMWVSGIYQYEYARHLGYPKNKIIFGIYTADVEKFNLKYFEYKDYKAKSYPHNILFVGRFTERKGIKDLIEAYKQTLQIQKHNWTLTLIGSGHLKEVFEKEKGIIIKDFMQPDDLVNEIKNAGIFCLPSHFEAWGLVVHEFVAAGLPVISSDECGAASEFIKNGYNGYIYKVGDVNELTKVLLKIISKEDNDLIKMGEKSHKLAQHVNPDISATNFMMLLNK